MNEGANRNIMAQKALLKATLQWYLDNGVDEILDHAPVDRTKTPSIVSAPAPNKQTHQTKTRASIAIQDAHKPPEDLVGAAEAAKKAAETASNCNSLEALKAAIAGFDAPSIKNMATNMVFSEGNPQAPIMVIGEAPGADEDRQGRPFVGMSGQLLDKILASIGLSRNAENLTQAVYLTNLLNWRPPGNRSPAQSEIDISLPFIERHIELVSPKILLFLGEVSGKSLLRRSESISKLRGTFHDYKGIEAITTYHPAYLLRTPAQKRAVWQDMLMLDAKRDELALK